MIDRTIPPLAGALLLLAALLAAPAARAQDAPDPEATPSPRALELFLLAEEARQRGEPERAAIWLDEVVRLDPVSVMPRLALASALLDMGGTARAEIVLEPIEERIEGAVDSLPDRASRYWRLRGAVANRLGAREKAVEHYERSARLAPYDLGLRAQLIGMYRADGKSAKAVRHLRAAADLVPFSPEVRLELGRALLALDRWGEAEAEFRQAVRIRPDLGRAWDGLGVSLIAQERYRQAEEALRHGLSVAPSSAAMHEHLGDALMGAGEAAEALRSYRRAAALSAEDGEIAEKIERARSESSP